MITSIFKNYFNGFKELSTANQNTAKTNVLATLKVLSYFTGIIPLACGMMYGISSLLGRISQKTQLSKNEQKVQEQAKKQLPASHALEHKEADNTHLPYNYPLSSASSSGASPTNNSLAQPIQISESKVVRPYPGDLSIGERSDLQTSWLGDTQIKIAFKKHPECNFTIRRQDIVLSGAPVIVNAANPPLKGGGGVDGQIHKEGGIDYALAHRQLANYYGGEYTIDLKNKTYNGIKDANYTLGHAAMIESGNLKEKYRIEHVIVVAGPQGDSTPEKETQLYSCYYNALVLAHSQGKTSLAFPAISTGIFKFPNQRAACISLRAVKDFIDTYPDTPLKTISIHFLEVQEVDKTLKDYEKAAKA